MPLHVASVHVRPLFWLEDTSYAVRLQASGVAHVNQVTVVFVAVRGQPCRPPSSTHPPNPKKENDYFKAFYAFLNNQMRSPNRTHYPQGRTRPTCQRPFPSTWADPSLSQRGLKNKHVLCLFVPQIFPWKWKLVNASRNVTVHFGLCCDCDPSVAPKFCDSIGVVQIENIVVDLVCCTLLTKPWTNVSLTIG